ncbi:MAG: DUF3857 domain-containing protein [Bacteroidetes bacterium]|nr:DUF3857 domain-containing protein [Bacteroidota bacterium]
MISRMLLCCFVLLLTLINNVYSQNIDAEVVRYTTSCEFRSGKLTQIDSITIQINNHSGDKYTEISIPYSKNERISDLNARIENMDGSLVRILKKSDIIDKSAISDISLYEDNFNKCFDLKHNVYPYKIIYTYKTVYRNFIAIANWTPVIYNEIPTLSAKLKIRLPKNFPFYKYENNIQAHYRIDSTESSITLQWKSSYIQPVKKEIFSQPDQYKPYIIVAPLYFQYGVEGSTKDWESFGNWQYRLIKDLEKLPDEEKSIISTLTKGITDKKEIVKILYHYLQDHTRYINVSIGIGGLKPYPALYVAENKYGDCKALTNYMKAMLSYVGIESHYTTVYASEQPHAFIKSFAGPQFNHVVLAVPLEKDTIWLENTLNTNPFGYMGAFTQNREALWVSKDHSKLVRIPALTKDDNLESYKLTFDLNINRNTTVALNISFKGRDFEMFNQLNSAFNDNQKNTIIRDYLPFENYEVVNWELNKIHRDTARIALKARLNLGRFLKSLGNEYYFDIFPSRIPVFSPPTDRTLPIVLPYPICDVDTLIYNLPIGYELKNRLDPVVMTTPFGKYELSLNVMNSKIIITKRFELFSGSYSLKQYSDFYLFIQSVKDIEEKKIIIKSIS